MCVYRTDEGICKKFSVDGVLSYCVDGPCPDEVLTNADRIRAMTDEELADAMSKEVMFTVCDAVCEGKCRETKEDGCKRRILEWLQQPAKEG